MYFIFLGSYFCNSIISQKRSNEIMEWKTLKTNKPWFMTVDIIWPYELIQSWDSEFGNYKHSGFSLHSDCSERWLHQWPQGSFTGASDTSFPDPYLTRKQFSPFPYKMQRSDLQYLVSPSQACSTPALTRKLHSNPPFAEQSQWHCHFLTKRTIFKKK